MPGELNAATNATPPAKPGQAREVNDQDKKLAADWLKRIQAALDRPAVKESFKTFERNRKLLRGLDLSGGENAEGGPKKVRTNLHYANLAMMRPQVYAKDPEYSIQPRKSVAEGQLDLVRRFCTTGEILLDHLLVKEAKLKKRAKRLLTSAYTTSVGWWKVCWQEDKKTDPQIANQLKDTQDNLQQLQLLRQQIDDPQACSDQDLKIAQMREQLAGLESQAEVTVSRGVAVDFVLSEDIIIIDASVRELCDYERAGAIAHRVWFTAEKFEKTFGFKPVKAKRFSEKAAGMSAESSSGIGKPEDLYCVFEVWDQDSNRVLTVCDGEEGFCRAPFSPDWTGERWFPFFGLAFNEIDGTFYPLSDIELTEKLVDEYNQNRDDFVRDRKYALPLNIVRKGGALTPDDVKRISNREGGDTVLVEGVGGQPIGNDIWSGALATIKPENYDTAQARGDIEQMTGGGDASRGSVLKAKTATEAEILSQGLRGRSAERTDNMEDLLSEVGLYVLQACLRKLTEKEVKVIAGADAVWPQLSTGQVFEMITVEVRGGSTGKPDRLQEQDRWTKLQPVIEKTVMTVADLYAKGQVKLGQALVAILRETLKRFDEKLDLDQYLPPAPEAGKQDPELMAQELQMLKAQLQELTQELAQAREEVEKGYVQAAAQIATSQDPAAGALAFGIILQGMQGAKTLEETQGLPGQDPPIPEPAMTGMPPQPIQ